MRAKRQTVKELYIMWLVVYLTILGCVCSQSFKLCFCSLQIIKYVLKMSIKLMCYTHAHTLLQYRRQWQTRILREREQGKPSLHIEPSTTNTRNIIQTLGVLLPIILFNINKIDKFITHTHTHTRLRTVKINWKIFVMEN